MKTMTRLLVFLLLGANVLLAQTATEKSILKLPLINRINNDYQVHLKKQTGEDHESVLALLK